MYKIFEFLDYKICSGSTQHGPTCFNLYQKTTHFDLSPSAHFDNRFSLLLQIIVTLVELYTGSGLGFLLLPVSGIIFLSLYGSFWKTLSVIVFGGESSNNLLYMFVSAFFLVTSSLIYIYAVLTLAFDLQRPALLISTVYSLYSAWTHVGWLGIIVALYLSFFSSDFDTFLMRNDNTDPLQSAAMQSGPGVLNGEEARPSLAGGGTN